MKSIVGRKLGMTTVFAPDGTMYPVTVIEVLPNVVLDKRTVEKNGYEALVVGYEDKAPRTVSKPKMGLFKKAGVSPKATVIELKGDEIYGKAVGETLTAGLFATGEVVDLVGHNKGHGYTGTIKRYHHHIGPKGHGSGYHRQIGSLANNGRCNNRVIPGKKMSGHWGPKQCTVQDVTIVESNADKGYILVKGGVPGPKKALVVLRTPARHQFKKPEVKALVKNVPATEAKGE